MQMDDEPGLLSQVLKKVAESNINILTINQTIPINGIASLTLSVEVLSGSKDISQMLEEIEAEKGIHYLKVLSKS